MDKKEKMNKDYEKLMKKYLWPSLEELESVLGTHLDKETNYYMFFTSALHKKLVAPTHMIANLFMPKDIFSMIEIKFFTNEEKEDLLKFGQDCLQRICNLEKVFVSEDNDEKGKIVKETYDFYKKEVMPFVRKLLDKMSDKWGEKSIDKEVQNYFG